MKIKRNLFLFLQRKDEAAAAAKRRKTTYQKITRTFGLLCVVLLIVFKNLQYILSSNVKTHDFYCVVFTSFFVDHCSRV